MPRITISIPDDLKRQLSDVRVRKALNVSRVCQEALRREVRRMLNLPLELERMEALLARLRLDFQDREEHWFSTGSANAKDWIEHEASLERLRDLGDLPADKRLERLRHQPPARLAELISQLEDAPDFDLESLLKGWAATLGLMWAVIKQNL